MIAGGAGVKKACEDAALVGWVQAAASQSRRVTSVCSGAFLLAATGLLDGRRVTTHWASCDELQRRHPEVEVDPKPIFVRDGEVWTSAGVTAGIDLALALVEQDLGREVPREVARWLVVFLQRPGGQAQFSAHLASTPASREPLRELQAWMAGMTASQRWTSLARTACSTACRERGPCSSLSRPVRNESRTMTVIADRSLADVLTPDIVVLPGGMGTRLLLEDEPLLSWLHGVYETTT